MADLFNDALKYALRESNRDGLRIKEEQFEALKTIVVERNDTVCVLPTGYGKSLIYQLLPLIFDFYLSGGNPHLSVRSSVIVVSPLNAIMVDQISKLKEHLDVRVLKSNDRTDASDDGSRIYDQLKEPSQIIFAHPEVLIEDKKIFGGILKSNEYQERVKAIVIDEAHLVSEWKEFRPCYGKLGMLASLFPSLPFLALTATATKQTKNIIVESLGLVEPVFFEINPDRSNIFFASKRRPNKGNDKLCPILIPLIEELKEKRQNSPLTVVYGNLETVSECFMFASKTMGPLQYEPLGSDPLAKNRMFTQFHAQYPDHERERIIKELTNGSSKLRLLFVTVAFGIGIDVDNIRRVIHIGVPRTVEEFFQEAGRCGRDGLDATSLVYFNSYDIASSRNVSQPMIDFVTSIRCKREIILSHFGHKVPERSVPDHLCCDFHQQTCECDCVLLSVSHLFLVECNPEGNDHNISTLPDDSAVHSPSLRKKSKLRKLLLDYRQLLHGSGRSCVGSISLSTGFSLELVDLVVEHAPELTTIEEVKSKLPIFSNDHADFIFNVVRSILSEDESF